MISSWKGGAWKDELRFTYGSMYIQNEHGEFCLVRNEIDGLIEDIEKLLEENGKEWFNKGAEHMFKLIRNEARGAGDLYKWVNDMQEEINKVNEKKE